MYNQSTKCPNTSGLSSGNSSFLSLDSLKPFLKAALKYGMRSHRSSSLRVHFSSSGPTNISTVPDDLRYLKEVLVSVYCRDFKGHILVEFSLATEASGIGRLSGFGIRVRSCHICGLRCRVIEVEVVQEAAFSFLVGINLNGLTWCAQLCLTSQRTAGLQSEAFCYW